MRNCGSTQLDKDLKNVIKINEVSIQGPLGQMVRSTVKETLNAMLGAETARNMARATVEKFKTMKLSKAVDTVEEGEDCFPSAEVAQIGCLS